MAERQEPWPAASRGYPPPDWRGPYAPSAPGNAPYGRPVSPNPPPTPARPPSGLFPGLALRPVYREPHPVRTGAVFAGLGSAVVWFGLFGGLARDLTSYAWWTIVAALTAWLVSIVLTVLGDRGVAVGIAMVSGFGLSIAMAFVAGEWITTEDWPLW